MRKKKQTSRGREIVDVQLKERDPKSPDKTSFTKHDTRGCLKRANKKSKVADFREMC